MEIAVILTANQIQVYIDKAIQNGGRRETFLFSILKFFLLKIVENKRICVFFVTKYQ